MLHFTFTVVVFHYAENEFAWKDDEEFGRQMLAGVNPARIQSLEVIFNHLNKNRRSWLLVYPPDQPKTAAITCITLICRYFHRRANMER